MPFPSSGGIKPGPPALVGGFFTAEPQGHSKICWHQQLPLNVKRVLCYSHRQRAVYHSSIHLLVSPGHKWTTLRLEVLSPLLFPARGFSCFHMSRGSSPLTEASHPESAPVQGSPGLLDFYLSMTGSEKGNWFPHDIVLFLYDSLQEGQSNRV